MVLHRGADDAAGVSDEVRHAEHLPLVQHALGLGGDRDIGPLDNELRLELTDVVRMDHVRAGGRDPDIAVDTDRRVTVQAFAVRIIDYAAA